MNSDRIVTAFQDLAGIDSFDVPELDRRITSALVLLEDLFFSPLVDVIDAIAAGFEGAAYDALDRALQIRRLQDQEVTVTA